MAEYIGPLDSEDDGSSVYGDYRFESKSVDDSGGDGFELPPWTDPPTGEIPQVLSELDQDGHEQRSRFPSVRFPSLSSSTSLEEVPENTHHLDGLPSEEDRVPARSRRHAREGRPYKRPPAEESDNKAIRISSGMDFSRQRRGADPKSRKHVPEDVFRPPEEIELPSKRFSVSIPKFTMGMKRKPAARIGSSSVSNNDVEPSQPEAATAPESAEEQQEFMPSSYDSRKARIHRAKTSSSVNQAGAAKRPLYIRIATGVGLGAIVLLGFYLGALTALAVVAVGLLLAVVEFYDTLRRAGFRPAALLGIAGTLSLVITTYQKGANGIALVFASMVVASMLWYLVGVIRGQPTINISATFLGFLWIGGLGSFGAAMLRPQAFPHSHGVAYLLGAIIVTVADDTAAYLFGSWIGKHKLAPEISPTKSWEGLIAGAVAAVIVSALIVSRISPWTTSKAVILGIIVAIVAPLGDLSESMIKRDLQIKDMGKLLPGHGGMLDRIDGLLFVLPTAYYLLKILHLS